MGKILIVAQGIVAKHFLQRIANPFYSHNDYLIVAPDPEILPGENPVNFSVHLFDPTSLMRLSELLSQPIEECFLLLDNFKELTTIYELIRTSRKQLPITILDQADWNKNDKNLLMIKANDILAQRMSERIPGVPITAQNIGLGTGEIMEVSVPFASSYVYRYIGSIEQKNWRIVAVYRSGQILLAKDSMVLQPNDNLLIIGDPAVLKKIYQAIKRELGQFPAPFGNNIYLYLDMEILSPKTIYKILDDALYLNDKLRNKKLFIRVVNAQGIETLNHIRSHDGQKVAVHVSYRESSFEEVLRTDVRRFGVGLILMERQLFDHPINRSILKELGRPVLRLSQELLTDVTASRLLLSKKEEVEKISPVVFDASAQLELPVVLYDYQSDSSEESINHYENLARIFSHDIEVITLTHENPLRILRKEKQFLHILPFDDTVCEKGWFWFLSTDTERLYFKISSANQLFIPV